MTARSDIPADTPLRVRVESITKEGARAITWPVSETALQVARRLLKQGRSQVAIVHYVGPLTDGDFCEVGRTEVYLD